MKRFASGVSTSVDLSGMLDGRETEKGPGDCAGIIASRAVSADQGPIGIDRTMAPNANVTDQGGAPIADAAHALHVVTNKLARQISQANDIALWFERKSGPARIIRAARAASLTTGGCGIGHVASANRGAR